MRRRHLLKSYFYFNQIRVKSTGAVSLRILRLCTKVNADDITRRLVISISSRYVFNLFFFKLISQRHDDRQERSLHRVIQVSPSRQN